MNMAYSGKCACGRISFEATTKALSVTWCYCITCQRQSGSPFLPFTDFDKDSISWTQEPEVWASSDIGERYFCKQCGSTIGMRYFFEPDRFGITVGLLDGGKQLELRPSAHIYLKDKPAWFDVPDDGARRWQEFNMEFTERIEQHRKKAG